MEIIGKDETVARLETALILLKTPVS